MTNNETRDLASRETTDPANMERQGEALLPCPFCGEYRVGRIKAHYIRDGQSLRCTFCGAAVHAFNPNAGDKCIALWNNRTGRVRELLQKFDYFIADVEFGLSCSTGPVECLESIRRLIKPTRASLAALATPNEPVGLREALEAIRDGKQAGQYVGLVRCREIAADALAKPSNPSGLPDDVVSLVIAAREYWDENEIPTDAADALDRALEAFASRVPYDDEPEAGYDA